MEFFRAVRSRRKKGNSFMFYVDVEKGGMFWCCMRSRQKKWNVLVLRSRQKKWNVLWLCAVVEKSVIFCCCTLSSKKSGIFC